jgi:hypothetical protein
MDRRVLPTVCAQCEKMIESPPVVVRMASGGSGSTKHFHLTCYPIDSRPFNWREDAGQTAKQRRLAHRLKIAGMDSRPKTASL